MENIGAEFTALTAADTSPANLVEDHDGVVNQDDMDIRSDNHSPSIRDLVTLITGSKDTDTVP